MMRGCVGGLLRGFGSVIITSDPNTDPPPNVTLAELRTSLGSIGDVWVNAPPESATLPYIVVYLTNSAPASFDGIRTYDIAIDVVAETFLAAQNVVDAIRVHDFPWSTTFLTEKDTYSPPEDGGEVLHTVTLHIRTMA